MTAVDERAAALLAELVALPGPSGQEEAVMAWLERAWAPHVERVWRTPVGNLVAEVGGQGPRLLLQAHADEISFTVRSIDPAGFLWLTNGQGRGEPHSRYPVGQPALVLGRHGPIEGLFATATGHIVPDRRREQPLTFDDLFVDIGAQSQEEARARGVYVGAGVIWNPPPRRLGTRFAGKALDDRVALAAMTRLLEQLDRSRLACRLLYAATVQEENGLLGASSLAQALAPDAAIALEIGLVGDIPTVGERQMPTALGQGPLLVHQDASAHYHYRLSWHLAAVAEQAGIPLQHAVFERFGSDGAELLRQGVPTAMLAVGTRYTHAAFEMIDLRDLTQTIALLEAVVTTPLSLG